VYILAVSVVISLFLLSACQQNVPRKGTPPTTRDESLSAAADRRVAEPPTEHSLSIARKETLMRFAARLFLLVQLLLPGCSSVSIKSDFDPSADFSTLKTYQWVPFRDGDDALAKVPLVQKRAMNAVDKALAAKGYRLLTEGVPDFYVAVHAGVQDKINVTDYGYAYGGWWGPYGPYGHNIDVSYYKEGTVFVDVIQKRTDKSELMWRGAGTGMVAPPDDPQAAQEKADDVAARILADFPPEKN
jgi:hypothetical protein